LIHDIPECADRALENGRESDIKDIAVFFKDPAAFLRFFKAFFRKVHVRPAREPVFLVPNTFTMTDENEFIHKIYLL